MAISVMSLPIHKRDFDFFLSHAHKDRAFVEQLYSWMTNTAGFRVWYDARELSGGALLASDLQQAIERCRGSLLVLSGQSLERGWVKNEYNAAMDERANHPDFRVMALRLPDASTTDWMKGTTWIDLPSAAIDDHAAFSIISACYSGNRAPNPASARDVYVSCSWHQSDNASARAVCRSLMNAGFRLVGDAKDQKGFGDGDRVERIIESCGAFVGVIPFRGADTVAADAAPYKYFARELGIAAQLKLPRLVIVDPRIRMEAGWLAMETEATDCPPGVSLGVEALWEDWQAPRRPQYVFLALDLASSAALASGPVRNIIERITGMPTIVGSEIDERPLHDAILQRIANAFLIVADITDDNLNTSIEAGMALALRKNLELLSGGKPRSPPFMLRSLQMPTYENEAERLGTLRRILYPYRRRVINAELR